MRRPVSSLLVAAVIAAAGLGVAPAGVAQASSGAQETRAVAELVASASVPDVTVAPVVEQDEDRTAGYVVMIVAVLLFVGGFSIIAVRARKR